MLLQHVKVHLTSTGIVYCIFGHKKYILLSYSYHTDIQTQSYHISYYLYFIFLNAYGMVIFCVGGDCVNILEYRYCGDFALKFSFFNGCHIIIISCKIIDSDWFRNIWWKSVSSV